MTRPCGPVKIVSTHASDPIELVSGDGDGQNAFASVKIETFVDASFGVLEQTASIGAGRIVRVDPSAGFRDVEAPAGVHVDPLRAEVASSGKGNELDELRGGKPELGDVLDFLLLADLVERRGDITRDVEFAKPGGRKTALPGLH